jgi:Sec-independent protein translocase protein TatA
MLDFSPEKMLFIFLIVAVVLGPEKLPELSRKIGRAVGELRKLSGGFREEMNKAVHEMSSDAPSNGPSSSSSAEISAGTPATGNSDDTSGS